MLESTAREYKPMEMLDLQPAQILILTDDFGGGTGNHMLSMTRFWDKSLFRVSIVSQARLTARRTPDVPVTYLPPSRRFEKYPLAQARRLHQLHRYLSCDPPDLIHAYFFWSIIYARILKRMGLVRFVVENREDQGFNWGRHEYGLLKWTGSVPDRVICVSEAVRGVVLQREGLDPDRAVVIHNGIEPAASPPVDRRSVLYDLGLAEDTLVVGMVSNLNRSIKGVSYFLDSIPIIVEAVPSARFLIVGGGKEQNALMQYAMETGVEPYVIFTGYQDDVARYYSVMDVSVLTSLSEGLSITLLESMSHALPVVATHVGGNPEVVSHGRTGYLVPPRDVRAFSARVVELLRDADLRMRMGREGLRTVADQFRIEQAARRYTEVYAGLLSSRYPQHLASTC